MVFAALLILLALWNGVSLIEWRVIACACLGIALCWALMLRPRVVFDPDALVLRNMVTDAHIPYAQLREVQVRSVTRATTVDGTRYVGLGVGRTRKNMLAPRTQDTRGFLERRMGVSSGPTTRAKALTEQHVPDVVEKLAEERMELARHDHAAEGAVRRLVAVPEVAALLLTLAGVVVAFTA